MPSGYGSLRLCESSHERTEIQSWKGLQGSSCQLLQFKGEESETQRILDTYPQAIELVIRKLACPFSHVTLSWNKRPMPPEIATGSSIPVLYQQRSHHLALYMKFPRTQKLLLIFFFFRVIQIVTKPQTDLFHSGTAQAMYTKSLDTTQERKKETTLSWSKGNQV